ncbi:MAG: hypothetical protein Q7R35_02515, partial [Elusimicrobiota bacterium]|nr:hypothetical protein [Elusimicrobiota bacterium]
MNKSGASGLTDAQIADAATMLNEYAASLKPLVNAAVTSPTNAYTNNKSNLTVAGASFMEVAAGYAWNVDK